MIFYLKKSQKVHVRFHLFDILAKQNYGFRKRINSCQYLDIGKGPD